MSARLLVPLYLVLIALLLVQVGMMLIRSASPEVIVCVRGADTNVVCETHR